MDRTITRDIDLVFDGVQLRAYTETIDGREVKVLSGTASSTAQDLYGSVIRASCQAKMLEKLQGVTAQLAGANSGLTAWLNHSYKIPEDTLGAFVGASLAVRNEDGHEFIDLDIKCRVLDSNPRAVAAWEQVQAGIRHGWSIGAYFTDIEWMSDDPDSPDFWNFFVNDIDLQEISLVGLPANQRAWCRGADEAKAKAVEVAEEIVKEARENPRELVQRFGVREKRLERATTQSRLTRSLVLRSLTHDGIADSATTGPITSSVNTNEMVGRDAKDGDGSDAKKPYGEVEYADPGYQSDGVHRYPLDTVEHIKAAASYFGRQRNRDKYTVTQQKKIDARIQAAEERHGIGEHSVVPPEQLSALDGGKWLEHASLDGIGEHSVVPPEQLSALDGEVPEISRELQELAAAGGDQSNAFRRAALAISILSSAAAAQEGLKTLDGVDTAKISDAIGHCADAVGHGLCIRDAKSIGKAVKCLSDAVGSTVEQPGPVGDEDPDETLFSAGNLVTAVKQLEPKAGDVIVITFDASIDQALLASVTESVNREIESTGAKVLFVSNAFSVESDNALAAAKADLDALDSDVVRAEEELSQLEATLSARKGELTAAQEQLQELQAKIETARQERLGRKSGQDELKERSADTSDVKPEHYYATRNEQHVALQRMASGESHVPKAGRDFAL